MEDYVWAICDKFFDQIEYGVASPRRGRRLPELHGYLNGVRDDIEEEIHHIAEKLADDPTWVPRMRTRKAAEASVDETVEKLGESLLAISRP